MRLRPTLLALAAAAAVSIGSTPARADEFSECQDLYDKSQFDAAYVCYKRGYDKHPEFKWAANLGNIEVKLGKYIDAIPHLEFAYDHIDPTLDASQQEVVRNKLRTKIAAANLKITRLTLGLTPADTTGATIAINGNVVGTTPLPKPILLNAGNYKITVTHPNYADLTRDFVAQPNTSPSLTLQMRPKAAGASSGGGVSPAMIGVGIAGGVLALGALGAGVGLLVASGSKADDREAIATEIGDNSTCADPMNTDVRCDQIESLADDENTFTTAGTAMLIVGGVLAAGTIVTVILWPSSSEQAGLWVAPNIGGLTLGGSF